LLLSSILMKIAAARKSEQERSDWIQPPISTWAG
jgi:hypothetical protein